MRAFFWTDIRQHKGSYFLFTLQCTVALFLIGYAGSMITNVSHYLEACNHVSVLKDSYVLRNMNTDEEFEYLVNAYDWQGNLLNAYWALMDLEEGIIYTVSPENNLYIDVSDFPMAYEDENGSYIEYIEVSEGFFDVFNVQSTLRSFDELFSNADDAIPVLLGNAFVGEIDVGKSFCDYYGRKFIVAGFIQNHPYYLRPSSNARMQNMDHLVVMPILPSTYTDEIDGDCAMSWTYYSSSLRKDVQAILEGVNLVGYAWREKSMADHIEWIETYEFQRSLRVVVVAIIFLIFSVLSMMVNLYIIIEESRRKYIIHYLCGARISTLTIRLVSSVALCVFCASSIAWMLNEATARPYIGVLALMILLFIMPYPIIMFNRHGIAELLRRAE